MPKKKLLTNEDYLKRLIKQGDDIDLAMARTYLLDRADYVLQHEDEVREEYAESFIHPNLIIRNAENIKRLLSDDSE